MIEVEHLTKKYGNITAVQDITFTAQPGQITGFLGPNGAGKTTTMRMLTGYMPPTAGKALVAGYDVFENSMEVRKRVGYLPENVPLYRDMSALRYLTYIGEIRGLKNRKTRAQEVLEQVGLTKRATSRIRTLSKGMRQRVGLASALLHEPEVLILDEPTIGLDPFQVLELRDLIRNLRDNHTVLFSTHILSEAEQICDSVIIINQGEIVVQGSPTELRNTLERGGRILVRVDAPDALVANSIRELPGVAGTVTDRDGIVVTPTDADIDPRSQIAQLIVENNWNLIELRPLAINLEEIFIEFTRRSQFQPNGEPTVADEEVTA